MSQELILHAISSERFKQDEQWGGAEHDDEHTPVDWEVFIKRHADRLTCAMKAADDDQTKHGSYEVKEAKDYRKRLIKIAALAVAAIESFDRKTQRVVIMPKDQS